MSNIHITSRMRRDANIYDPVGKNTVKKRGRPRKRGKKLPAPQHMVKHIRNWRLVDTIERGKIKKRLVYSRRVIWYTVSETPVLLVISRDPEGKERDDFFVTTDLDLSCSEVISGISGRWSIEDTFKNTKQFIGGQEPQTWKGKGPERATALSLWLYSVVWLWYLQRRNAWRSFRIMPGYPIKCHPSFQGALGTLRRTLWTKRIKSMFGKSTIHDKKTEFLILALSKAA